MDAETVERLKEIQQEFFSLLDEAKSIIRKAENQLIWERARSYWLAHIEMALSKETEFLGSSMFTMDETIEEIERDCDEEDEFEDEE